MSTPLSGVHRLALAIGGSILTALLFYVLSWFFYDRNPFLRVSTFMTFSAACLNAILIWRLQSQVRAPSSQFGRVLLMIGMIGAFIAVIGATNDFLNSMVGHDLIIWFPLSQSIIVVGYGFIGIWLLLLNDNARRQATWPNRLAWLGIFTGIILAVGLLAIPRIFIPWVSLNHELVPEIGELIGYVGWMLIYPLWSIWFGCAGLNDKHEDPHVRSFV
jgi:hypothetical protein